MSDLRRRGSGSTEEYHAMAWDGDDGYVEQRPQVPPFGYMLTLDLYDCNAMALDDIRRVYAFLETLVHRLGMTKQAPPFVFLSPPEFPDKAGVSGWVPLIESGIQIHTLTPCRFVSVDVYCCRKFNIHEVQEVAQAFFNPAAIDVNEITRGAKYHARGR
jgi:S-adenosylmethionine decarboxylase